METIENKHYNLRVYALIEHNNKYLITDEIRFGIKMTKFTGGGMHWGEGPVESLQRELLEELGQESFDFNHFYTTEDFVPASLIGENHQLIAIYYEVRIPYPDKIPVTSKRFDFNSDSEGEQTFRWLSLEEMNTEDFNFVLDKRVVDMLKSNANE